MKKTVKISLQGSVFHIDEDAYALLKKYLAEIGNYFGGQAESAEILEDIEIRIAEIFTERLGDKREVVSLEDVEYVISQLGKPADIFGEENGTGPTAPSARAYTRKRLYRDPENSVLGGVCGGLGAYFDIDPVWFRVFFVLLTLGYGIAILIYIILWIALPEAKSPAQRLEMRGEQVTIDNIGKSVREEFTKVKDNIRDIPQSQAYRKTSHAFQEFFHVIGQILLTILKIIGAIIAVTLIIGGILTLVALIGVLFFRHNWFFTGDFISPSFYLPDLLGLVTAPENVPYIIASLILTLAIPLLALVYGGIKIIFQIRSRDRVLGLTFFVIWLISAVSLSFFIIDIAARNAEGARLSESYTLGVAPSDTLYVTTRPYPIEQMMEIFTVDELELYRDENTGEVLGRPQLDIVATEKMEAELEVYRRARGHTRNSAVTRAEDIRFRWDSAANTLRIDPWYVAGTAWSGQRVDLKLRLPEGTVVCLDKSLRKLLDYVPHELGYRTYNLPGKCWTMTGEELVRQP